MGAIYILPLPHAVSNYETTKLLPLSFMDQLQVNLIHSGS